MNIYLAGIIGGLVGGVVFGMMMAMMGMLPMVAKLWGRSSSGFGFLVHLINSAIIGTIYVVVVPFLNLSGFEGFGTGAIYGLVYGFIWWILGPLVIMPLWLKMPMRLSPRGIKQSLPSLKGHLVYGVLLGLTVAYLL